MAPTEFFSSFEDGDPEPEQGALAHVRIGGGPARPHAARPRAGFTGPSALHYGAGGFRTRLFTVDLRVTELSELSYLVLPESPDGSAVSVDLEFADGGTLDTRAGATGLYPNQWNLVRHHLAEATGRTVRAIVLGTEEGSGWLDDVRISEREPSRCDPVDHVRTTRGTHSSATYSRGNCLPATAVPHGFNFWIPVTDARALNWPYEYHRRNNRHNRPVLEALGLSHQPSPWIGDRHTFHVQPGTGSVTASRRRRARPFSHENETDRPYHYGVRFDNGGTAEIAPTDHAAILRFSFPEPGGWLLFDNARNRGGLRVNTRRGTISGHSWVRSRDTTGARRMYVHAAVDPAPEGGRKRRRPPWRRVTGYLRFGSRDVTLRIATSLISRAQARRNLDLELPPTATFDEVRERARQAWTEVTGLVDVEGATDDERTTFYSCLYRLFLYPNSAHEHTPRGVRHALLGRRGTGPGELYVNNGFWDTYRTVWPAYALLAPEKCARLIEGFVQHYRDAGWIPRWSCPGPADQMVGTSSDAAFADAYLKGVRGFDAETAYDAAVKNATVTPPRANVGRKGLDRSIFLGYTSTSTREGLSWALEGFLNDHALARWSERLAEETGPGEDRHEQYRANAEYFGSRAGRYVDHWDGRVGFFQELDATGRPRREPGRHDPRAWGHGCAETNAWTMAFAVPHDVDGLVALHGGRERFLSTLDTYFTTPESGTATGSYRRVLHEMREARDVGLGQYGHSNQPAHHVPYLYAAAGRPARTQSLVREVLRRCYPGSEIGQGYLGDEDNGEMSAWYVFSALGFYPLAPGSPWYVLGSPLFHRAVVHLGNGRRLVVNAPDNSERNVYVQGVHVDGRPHESPWIAHDVLVAGAVLDFAMGPAPSRWGESSRPARRPWPLRDLAGVARCSDGTNPAALLDDTTRTEVAFSSAQPIVELAAAGTVRLYTLTSAARDGDPSAWTVEGSPDGRSWTVLDEREGESFRWRRQTRAFRIAAPRRFAHHRLRITGSTHPRVRLAQWELLA